MQHKGATDPREWPMGVPKRASATFGVPLGTYKPDPKGFTKKHAGEITLPDRTPLPTPLTPIRSPIEAAIESHASVDASRPPCRSSARCTAVPPHASLAATH